MSFPPRSGRIALYAALAAVIFFGRAWLIRSSGSVVPFWDQWDAEALGLYRPWLDGSFHWSLLWQPHNEHRIVLTRLLDLLLLSALGEWNLWAELLVNAALHTGIAVLLAAWFSPGLNCRQQTAWVTGVALLFLCTAGWQNALWGFQSPVYFTSLVGLAAIGGMVMSAPGSARWWGGFGCAVLALFTTGGGVLASVAALGVGLLTGWSPGGQTRRWAGLLAMSVIVVIGFWLSTTVPGHAPLRARSIEQFAAVFSRCLAFPWVNVGLLAVPLQLPVVILLWRRWRSGAAFDAWERGALGVLLFTGLQAAGVAYSRGHGLVDARPLSRYQDLLIPGLAVQIFALVRLSATAPLGLRVAGLLWVGLVLSGLIHLTEQNLTFNLPYKRAQDRAGLAAIQGYVATGDLAAFTRDPTFPPPHPDPRVMQKVLDDPLLRPLLPPNLLSGDPAAAPIRPWLVQWSPHLLALSIAGLTTLLGRHWRNPLSAGAAKLSRPPPRPD